MKTRTGHGPLALLEHGLDGLDNAGVGLRDIFGLYHMRRTYTYVSKARGRRCDAGWYREETHGEVLERTGLFDVGEGGLELLKLDVDLSLGLLGFSNLFAPSHHTHRNSRQKKKAERATIQSVSRVVQWG